MAEEQCTTEKSHSELKRAYDVSETRIYSDDFLLGPLEMMDIVHGYTIGNAAPAVVAIADQSFSEEATVMRDVLRSWGWEVDKVCKLDNGSSLSKNEDTAEKRDRSPCLVFVMAYGKSADSIWLGKPETGNEMNVEQIVNFLCPSGIPMIFILQTVLPKSDAFNPESIPSEEKKSLLDFYGLVYWAQLRRKSQTLHWKSLDKEMLNGNLSDSLHEFLERVAELMKKKENRKSEHFKAWIRKTWYPVKIIHPAAFWRALYKIVDFEGIANAFLCQLPILDSEESLEDEDEDGEEKEEEESEEKKEEDQEEEEGEEREEEKAEKEKETNDSTPDTGLCTNVPEGDVPPQGTSIQTSASQFKVAQWSQLLKNPVLKDYIDHTVIFITSDIAENEIYVGLKSKLLEREDWFEISAKQSSNQPNQTVSTTEDTSGKNIEKIGSSSLTILIRRRNDVKIELILCMEYYQMVWMQVQGEFFVLINCDSECSIYGQHANSIEKEHLELNMTKVLNRLLKDMGKREVNIVMSAKVHFIPIRLKQEAGGTNNDAADSEFRWNTMIPNPLSGSNVMLAFCGTATFSTDTSKTSFDFEMRTRQQEDARPSASKRVMTAVTWNVAGCDGFCDKARLEKVLVIVKSSDVIYLQEFPPARVNALSKSNHPLRYHTKILGWRALEHPTFVYNATFLKNNFPIEFCDIKLLDKVLACEVKLNGTAWKLLNCHLKAEIRRSENNLKSRKRSFELMTELVCGSENFLVGGDTNLPTNEQSDANLQTYDVWRRFKRKFVNEKGPYWDSHNEYTWNCKQNMHRSRRLEAQSKNIGRGPSPGRLDRFYLKSNTYECKGYDTIGKEETRLNVTKQHLSDHYGVKIKLELRKLVPVDCVDSPTEDIHRLFEPEQLSE